jgi:exosortase D (VPLPA-CTERM-specific)
MHASAHPAPRTDVIRWQLSWLGRGILGFALLVAFIPFYNVLSGLFNVWNLQPEYSHGVLIPLISVFLIWRERDALTRMPFQGSWFGIALLLVGVAMWGIAQLSTLYAIGQYAFLLVLYGLVLALVGPAVFGRLKMPLLILLFAIPLPTFFANSLSLRLQLLSSAIGVEVIRLFGISVFLDGNIIDLGPFKLQVVEACSGLRYLFPLMTLAFILAYLFRAATWKRVLLFLSSIPVAILLNSLRIGLIGVTVEYWGVRMAEGVLHDFEGWVVFMISLAFLLLIAAGLVRVGNPQGRLRNSLALDFGPSPPRSVVGQFRKLPIPFLVATALTTAAAVLAFALPERVEVKPGRASFVEFPLQWAGWTGRREPLEAEYQEQLKLDDYLLANFDGAAPLPVNVWIAYYDSQRNGAATHSPRSCLPGGGWDFTSFDQADVPVRGGSIRLNRAVITHGSERQLMYYWFQQRGRVVTNEYLVKWYMFVDAITRNRTDGALVRLIAPIPVSGTEAQADRVLTRFTGDLWASLPRYVPN